MKRILYTIISTRLRKIVSKEDTLGKIFIVAFYLIVSYFIFLYFEKIGLFFYILFFDTIIYHIKRKDLDLIKLNKRYKTIILTEYLIYSSPFLMTLILKGKIKNVIIIILIYFIIIQLPKFSSIIIKYPFKLGNPYWHIIFRNYKVLYWLPILYFMGYMGIKHNNENIHFFVLLVVFMIINMTLFEREREVEIKYANYNSEEYLQLQIKTNFINLTFYILPLICFLFILTFNVNIILFTIVMYVFSISNIVFKYYFFYSSITQQIFLTICILSFGIPLLMVPFLYKKSVLKINDIKNA